MTRENVGDDAPGDVGRAAGRKRYDHGYGARRIGLRLRAIYRGKSEKCRHHPWPFHRPLPEWSRGFLCGPRFLRPLFFLACRLHRLRGLLGDLLLRCRLFHRTQAAFGVLHLVLGELPALPVDIENDAVRVAELALEAVVLRLAEIEEELAAGLLDLLLLLRHVVALEAEVMDAGPAGRNAGADLALVLQQREIDLAVAHVAIPGGLAFLDLGALEAERLLVEVGGLLDVLHAKRDVPDAGWHLGGCFCSHWIVSTL